MKKHLETLKIVLIVVVFFVGLGLVINLVRYTADRPVAKVELIKFCRGEGGNSHFGGYFPGKQFANVKILSVSDTKEFQKVALKISKDGERANLNFSYGLRGKTLKCYGEKSLRGSGLAGWWNNFGYYWKKTTLILFVISALAILFICVVKRGLDEK